MWPIVVCGWGNGFMKPAALAIYSRESCGEKAAASTVIQLQDSETTTLMGAKEGKGRDLIGAAEESPAMKIAQQKRKLRNVGKQVSRKGKTKQTQCASGESNPGQYRGRVL